MRNHTISTEWIKHAVFIVIIIGIAFLLFINLSFFLSGFLGAFTLYMLLRKPHAFLTEKWNWRPTLSSLTLLILAFLGISAIGYGIFEMVASKLSLLNSNELVSGLKTIETKVNQMVGHVVIPDNIAEKSAGTIMQFLSSLLSTTYSFAANLFMMLFMLFFMLSDSVALEKNIRNYIPFSAKNQILLKRETRNMVLSNAIGIPLIMLMQGLASVIGYAIFGVSEPLFWGVITGLFSLVPMVGTTLIWLPMGVYLISTGLLWQGIGLMLFGALIVTNVDSVLRFVLMKKMANVHPLITVFGVILGINLFGFWGIIFGPLLISAFFLLLNLYRTEYWVKEHSNNILTPDNECDTTK